MTLRFLTSGESHGRGYLITIDGLPAGLTISTDQLRSELARRRRGWGRGPRMKLEKDRLTVWGGLRDGVTTGAPLGIALENTEWESWREVMDPEKTDKEAAHKRSVTCPRPGHADLTGAIKYDHKDMRNVLERASARLTASWTIVGTVARILLSQLNCDVRGSVTSIGGVTVPRPSSDAQWERARINDLGSPLESSEADLVERITAAQEDRDTLGGTFIVSLKGVPAGIGSHVEWDRKLDGRLASALMAIPAIKGVEIGEGFDLADVPGSMAHDELAFEKGLPVHLTNRAGGIEGGMSNGEEILIRAAMKPIPTLKKPLRSIDLETGENTLAHFERSDTCAVPAACVVGEAMAAWVIASSIMEQFGGDTLKDLKGQFDDYRNRSREYCDNAKKEE